MPPAEVELAALRLLELFPPGLEEVARPDGVELTVYLDADEAARFRNEFPAGIVAPVPEGWEEEWKRFHVSAVVGPLWIGPPWEAPPAGLIPVVVDPGRAFGTGAHPTTRLCLELLHELDRGSVLDIGCGSGVLAIAAAKLGHAPVTAVDVDPASVEATRQNAAANGVAVDVRLADGLGGDLPRADVALANIELRSVEAVAAHVECDVIITSGYYRSESPQLTRFRRRKRRTSERWAADLYVRI